MENPKFENEAVLIEILEYVRARFGQVYGWRGEAVVGDNKVILNSGTEGEGPSVIVTIEVKPNNG